MFGECRGAIEHAGPSRCAIYSASCAGPEQASKPLFPWPKLTDCSAQEGAAPLRATERVRPCRSYGNAFTCNPASRLSLFSPVCCASPTPWKKGNAKDHRWRRRSARRGIKPNTTDSSRSQEVSVKEHALGGGQTSCDRLIETRRGCPELVTQSNEAKVQLLLQTPPGEAWSWRPYADQFSLPAYGNFKKLRSMVALLACTASPATQMYALLVEVCFFPRHDLFWGWPVLNISNGTAQKHNL